MSENEAQPELPERDATPDEAFRLGEISGYNEGWREGRKAFAKELAAADPTVVEL